MSGVELAYGVCEADGGVIEAELDTELTIAELMIAELDQEYD